MKKDAYYFPHFCNARHDRKLKRVQKELGIEGYGIYFMLLETLREQDSFKYPIEDLDLLADEFGTSEQKVRTVVSNYKLFLVDDNGSFTSPKLIEYLTPYLNMREQRRLAGIKSGEARRIKSLNNNKSNGCSTGVKRKLNENEQSKVKESKEKKRKIFKAPSFKEIKKYCIERKNSVNPESFLNHYEANGWMRGKNKIKDWKACVRTWEQNDKEKNHSKTDISTESWF